MPTYIGILGRQPELSVAELAAGVVSSSARLSFANDQALLIDAPETFPSLFPRFGGLVKLGEVIGSISSPSGLFQDTFFDHVHRHLAGKGKTVFGVSRYGLSAHSKDILRFEKTFKVFLAENGRPSRFVTGERGVLSSVVVSKERLMEKGMELLLVAHGTEILAAKTIAVQAFEDFSGRDYGRPKRDAVSGMLSPKLARILVNLSGATPGAILLDPFCGSGTVLQEALLLGCHSVVGTDRSEKAIREARENINWIVGEKKITGSKVILEQAEIANLGKLLRPTSVDVVVTEPYLGPPQRGGENLDALRDELEKLYTRAFQVLARLVRPGGRVVFLFPVFYRNEKPAFIRTLDALSKEGFQQIDPIPPGLLPYFADRLSYRKTILYRRPGQRVGREIVLFSKKA